jgi:hypothetical protein
MKSPTTGLCVALLLFAAPVLPAAVAQSRNSTDEKYAQVLDLVFRTDWCDGPVEGGQVAAIGGQEFPENRADKADKKENYLAGRQVLSPFSKEQMTLRVLPGLWEESQIVICKWPGGKTILIHSTLLASEGMVWTPVVKETMGRHKRRSVEAIAAAFHPVHQLCDADAAGIGDWFKQLRLMSFDVPKGGGLDGITYEITLQAGMNEIRARVWGPDDQVSLIPWVENVQKGVAKMSCKEIQYLRR